MSAKHDQLMLSQLPLSLTWGYIIHSEAPCYMCTKHPEPGADGRCRLPYLSARRDRHNCILILVHRNNYSILRCHRSQMFFPSHPKCRIMLDTSEGGGKVFQQPPEIKSIDGFCFNPYWFTSVPKCFLEKSRRKTLAACQLIDHACCN